MVLDLRLPLLHRLFRYLSSRIIKCEFMVAYYNVISRQQIIEEKVASHVEHETDM